MRRTQIQLPDALYFEAKRVANQCEISFSEVVRRGVEYITRVYASSGERQQTWSPPAPHHLGGFLTPVEDWRLIAEEQATSDDLR